MTADPKIKAEVLLDSVNIHGNRLTTFIVTFPRIILAEFNTHRMLSRNSASSRAIPFLKQVKKVESDPFVPVFFGKNQKGMQANEEVDEKNKSLGELHWRDASQKAISKANDLNSLEIHKQITNRLLEPWLSTTVIVSATSWNNFFKLRAHPDAQPEFQVLAYRMLEQYMNSWPNVIDAGQYHIPFGDRMPPGLEAHDKIKIATARCARVSYETFDGEINVNSDFELCDSLLKNGHMSPFEHCAMSAPIKGQRSGNFLGWLQYREFVERREEADLVETYNKKPDWI